MSKPARTSAPALRATSNRRPGDAGGSLGRARTWLVALTALAACGTDDRQPTTSESGRRARPGAAAAVERLQLLDAEGGLGADRSQSHQRFTAPPAATAWQVSGATVAGPGASAAARLTWEAGKDPVQFTIPGEFNPSAFNTVVVEGTFAGECEFTLQLLGPGATRATAPVVGRLSFPGAGTARPVSVDLRQPPTPGAGPLERLSVTLRTRAPGEILSVDLVQVPLIERLPLPGAGAAPIELGVQTISGVGLVSGRALVGEFEVAGPQDALAFSIGRLPAYTRKGPAPELSIVLSAPGVEALEERIALPDAETDLKLGWLNCRIPLGSFQGLLVDARLELQHPGDVLHLCAVGDARVERPQVEPPSTLLISSDTHRADHLGAHPGGVEIRTPVLDELASRGVLFTDCFADTNVTSPSHVTLMTGLSPRDTRIIENTGRLAPDAPTLARAFQAAGWRTLAVTSIPHLGIHATDLTPGFDRTISVPARTWPAELAVGYLQRLLNDSPGVPTFAFLHIYDAHHPYEPPGEFDRLYYDDDADPFGGGAPVFQPRTATFPPDLAGLTDLEFPLSQYRAEITYLDDALQALLARPEFRRGHTAFTSDHGEILAKGDTFFNHGQLYPDTLHIPLILAGPGVPAAATVAAPVRQANLGRTLLDLAGLEHVAHPGTSVLEREPPTSATRFALSAHGFTASVQSDNWFLVLALLEQRPTPRRLVRRCDIALYDLDADPECRVEVAAQNVEVTRRLRAELVDWLDGASPTGLKVDHVVSQEALAQLEALGYTTGIEQDDAAPWFVDDCDCPYK